MTIGTIIFLSVITLILLALVFQFYKSDLTSSSNKLLTLLERINNLSDKVKSLSEQNSNLRTELDKKLAQTHQASQSQFKETAKLAQEIHGQSARLITNVTEKLTKLDETNKQVINFSQQLQNLQDILKNPKQRGVLGEYFLEETLSNVLPPKQYLMQYNLGKDDLSGKDLIVDAVVFVKGKLVPIDAKFSLENYERLIAETNPAERAKLQTAFRQDIKLRINETAKYVLPERGTMDFAFMFIPSESIYYDLLVNDVSKGVNARDLIEYAFREKKVVIVSPVSFLAYLQTVLQGLKAMEIEERAKEITANIEKLGRHLLKYDEFFRKLGSSLGTTVNHYNNAYKELNKIDKDVTRITGVKSDFEVDKLDKPNLDDD